MDGALEVSPFGEVRVARDAHIGVQQDHPPHHGIHRRHPPDRLFPEVGQQGFVAVCVSDNPEAGRHDTGLSFMTRHGAFLGADSQHGLEKIAHDFGLPLVEKDQCRDNEITHETFFVVFRGGPGGVEGSERAHRTPLVVHDGFVEKRIGGLYGRCRHGLSGSFHSTHRQCIRSELLPRSLAKWALIAPGRGVRHANTGLPVSST